MSGARVAVAGAAAQGMPVAGLVFQNPDRQDVTLSNAPGGVRSVKFPRARFESNSEDQIVSLSLEYAWGTDGADIKAILLLDKQQHNMNSYAGPASILFRPMKIKTLNKLLRSGWLYLSEDVGIEPGRVTISLFVTPEIDGAFHIDRDRIGGELFSINTLRSPGMLSPSSRVAPGFGISAQVSPVKDETQITKDDGSAVAPSAPTSPEAAVRAISPRINIGDLLAGYAAQSDIVFDIAGRINESLGSTLLGGQYDEVAERITEILAAPVPVRATAVAINERTPLLVGGVVANIIPIAKVCLAINVYLADEGLQASVYVDGAPRASEQDIAAMGAILAQPLQDDIDVAAQIKTEDCRERAKKAMLGLEAKAQTKVDATQDDPSKVDEAACWQAAAKQARQYYDATLHPNFGPTSVRVSALMAFIAIGATICSAIALSDKSSNESGLDVAGIVLGVVGLARSAHIAAMAYKAWPEGVNMRGSLALAGIIALTGTAAVVLGASALSRGDSVTPSPSMSATVFGGGPELQRIGVDLGAFTSGSNPS